VLNFKFSINIKENPKPLVILVKGEGESISLIQSSDTVNIGPVLPYDDKAYAVIKIRNASEHDTELYSLDND
jgi:hypothetical protein